MSRSQQKLTPKDIAEDLFSATQKLIPSDKNAVLPEKYSATAARSLNTVARLSRELIESYPKSLSSVTWAWSNRSILSSVSDELYKLDQTWVPQIIDPETEDLGICFDRTLQQIGQSGLLSDLSFLSDKSKQVVDEMQKKLNERLNEYKNTKSNLSSTAPSTFPNSQRPSM